MSSPEHLIYSDLLKETAQALDGAAIPYVVIGGQAVLIHGEPRFTRDIDVTLGATPDRLQALLEAAENMGLKVLVDDPDRFARETYVLPCENQDSDIRVDFIFSFTPFEQQAIDRAATVDVEGYDVKFARLEDLLVHKIVAGRSRDLDDAKRLMARHPDADFDHVRYWLKQFEDVTGKSLEKRLDDILKGLK